MILVFCLVNGCGLRCGRLIVVVVRYLAMGVAGGGLAYQRGYCERRLLCFAGLDLLVRVDGFDSVDGVGSIAVMSMLRC
jgi:hypothetical protein